MMLQAYSKIPNVNVHLLQRFRSCPNTNRCDWYVTEMVDGDHLALYADASKDFFKAATRKRFLNEKDDYSDWKGTVELHKHWVLALSRKLQSPVIVYGKMVGGIYKGKSQGRTIRTVTEYCVSNDFVIHDIKVKGGFIAPYELKTVSKEYVLTLAPLLYIGKFNLASGFPENKLSALPFTYELPIKWDNEMKGVVMRPLLDMNIGRDRLIMKKLNVKHIGKKNTPVLPLIHNDLLVEVAEQVYNEARRLDILSAVISAHGTIAYNEIDKVAGKFVKTSLDKVNYLKYNILTNKEKNLVNKELNTLARLRLLELYRKNQEAA